ncbi:solute carrier organic anion transporter family member 4A1-like isoform X1 [Littorina saxatilis]|uniref:Solute carrier organic anion transporter family member n=1 Tax=Littorina saxatilis TaxID=31220 RepID=A0AAN9GD66_9CAEN
MTETSSEANGSGGGKTPGKGGVDNVAFTPSAGEGDVVVSFQPGQKPSCGGETVSKPDDVDHRYGCGSFKPGWLQKLANIKVFVFLVVLLCLVEGFAVNGIASASLVHLEKQFGLTSTRSALISSSQDIGALVVVLFVSFLGNRFNKPHWVAMGSLIMAVGSLLFIVPHLATGASPSGSGPPPTGLCDLSSGGSAGSGESESEVKSLSSYLGVFMVANMVHGVGFTPMFTLGTVYIDENEEHSMAAVYVGFTYAAAAVGVAMGFFVGGQLTEKYYVDFDSVDQDTLTFGPRDPQWVGAWWLGFIPSCICFVLLAALIYGFPRSLPREPASSSLANCGPGEKKVEAESNGTPDSKDGDKSFCTVVKEVFILFFQAVKKLAINPMFILLSLGSAAATLIISGVSSFAFKYLAEQYSMSFDVAGNFLGGLIIVGSVGMVGGGVLIRVFRLEAVGMTRLMVGLNLLAAVLGVAILADCADVQLAGQEVAYPGDTSVTNYSSGCQGNCMCGDVSFDPVCGSDRRVYFSPCHAGCVDINNPGPSATYHNCSCVALARNVSQTDAAAMADRGRCSESCDNRNIFMPCLFIMFFAVLLTTTPNSMAILRVVDQDIRPFALGFQWMLIRLLGTIPGPPVVGYVLDQTCLVWNTSPDGTEFCAMYSKSEMSSGIFIWWIVVVLLATLFYLAASCLMSRRNSKSVDLN